MSIKLLISHATEDERAAALLQELIERCSLKQIKVWFSSDRSGTGGIAMGAAWFANLLQRLNETDLIVALITKNSVASPWLYFECGHLAHKGQSTIVPLTLGLSLSAVPMPLSAYQGYDLSTSDATQTFLMKLFDVARVPFDDDMTRSLRSRITEQLVQIAISSRTGAGAVSAHPNSDLDDLRRHVDKRFLELHSLISARRELDAITPDKPSVPVASKDATLPMPDPLPTQLRFVVRYRGHVVTEFEVQMAVGADVQDILNECYFMLKQHGILVGAYRYKDSWIIADDAAGVFFESDGRADERSAIEHFDPTKRYSVEILDNSLVPDFVSKI